MNKSFTKKFLVDQSAGQVFDTVMNIRSWWQGLYEEEFTGRAEKINDEFTFRAGGGMHNTTQKLVELIPGKKLVWLVTESDLTFLEKKDEWKGTKLVFGIAEKGDKTELTFTHEGLVPEIECYDSCSSAWNMYMEERLLLRINSYSKTIAVNVPAIRSFDAIKNFRGWWSEDIEGETDKLNEIFFYHYKDIHLCRMKLIHAIPGQKLIYEVVGNRFNFIDDQSEWVGTRLVFDIFSEGERSKIIFTHEGLVRDYECFQVCNDAWNGYIGNSLKNFIETGKGNPNPKDKDGFNAELAEKWGLLGKA